MFDIKTPLHSRPNPIVTISAARGTVGFGRATVKVAQLDVGSTYIEVPVALGGPPIDPILSVVV